MLLNKPPIFSVKIEAFYEALVLLLRPSAVVLSGVALSKALTPREGS